MAEIPGKNLVYFMAMAHPSQYVSRASGIKIFLSLLLIWLTGCSVQKKIHRNANEMLQDSLLHSAHVGISVYEPATQKFLYNYQADKYFVPASNTKIPTCYAGLKFLGDSLIGMRYSILNDSVIRIIPMGDPSFLHPGFLNQPMYDFLKKYKYIEVSQTDFNESYLGYGWTWNDHTESYAAKRSLFPIYGNTFSIKWVNPDSISVTPGRFQSAIEIKEKLNDGFFPIIPFEGNMFSLLNGSLRSKTIPFYPHLNTTLLLLSDTLKHHQIFPINFEKTPVWKNFYTQPTDTLLKKMMHPSDNFFAEQVLLMASQSLFGEMKDEKVIDTMLKTVLHELPQKPTWVDGSGLSRYNLFSPLSMVAILDKMQREFGMERIRTIFPAGNEGTLKNYYISAQHAIYAKTGTLTGVVALSGFLYTRQGKLLIFSVLVNNHKSNAPSIRRLVEKFLMDIRERY